MFTHNLGSFFPLSIPSLIPPSTLIPNEACLDACLINSIRPPLSILFISCKNFPLASKDVVLVPPSSTSTCVPELINNCKLLPSLFVKLSLKSNILLNVCNLFVNELISGFK